MEYLREAVVGHSRARDACSRANAGEIGYQQFYSQLEAAIQLEQEEKIGRMRDQKNLQVDTFAEGEPSFDGTTTSCTYFNGQSRYAKPPRFKPKSNRRKNYGQGYHGKKSIRCFGCNEEGHIVMRCLHRSDKPNAAAARVQYLQRDGVDQTRALKRVLFEICEQIAMPEVESDYDPAETFFSEERDKDADLTDLEDPGKDDIAEQLFTSAVSYREDAVLKKDFLHEDF